MISPLIRSATTADIAAIAAIDFATNEGQPFAIPWAKPEDGLLMFKKRFEFYFTQPTFHFLVAEAHGSVVGFLAWKVPGKGEEEEWIPDFPEGTNVEFLEWYLEGIKEDADGLGVGDLYEIESLAIAPDQQRKGLGTALLTEFVKVLDESKVGCYLRGSSVGKELYERFGWRVLKVHRPDLKRWGYGKEYVAYHMRRDAKQDWQGRITGG